jgi:hypothetical protein
MNGVIAALYGDELPLQVLESGAGFYLGTWHPQEGPNTRESVEYWPTRELAQGALDSGNWTQRAGR